MEFISRLFVALFSLFFGDYPFSLDDDFQVQEEEVFPNSPQTPDFLPAQGPILLTPEMDRKWRPSSTSTPLRPRRLFFVPALDNVCVEQKTVVGPLLHLNKYLLNLEVTGGDTLYKAPSQVPLRRMGIRV
jgi:hypothetical protein